MEAPFAGLDEVYMSYNIKFRPGFQWVEGGKLPGLGGGPAYVISTSMGTRFSLKGLKQGFSYKLTVSAYDSAGNKSAKSDSLTVVTDGSDI